MTPTSFAIATLLAVMVNAITCAAVIITYRRKCRRAKVTPEEFFGQYIKPQAPVPIAQSREFELLCVDGPHKGHTEKRRLIPGAEFFLNLQSEETGITCAYGPDAMTKEGKLAMKFIAQIDG